MDEFYKKYAFLIKIFQKIIHSKLFPQEQQKPLSEESKNLVNCSNIAIKLQSSNPAIHNVKVDLYEITPKDCDSDRVIVEFMPISNTVSGRLNETALMAHSIPATIYTFNYPNNIKTAADLIDSAISFVNYLLYEKKVPAEKITLYGYCYGGVVAQHVKEYFKKRGVDLPLIGNNPFTSFTASVAEVLKARNFSILLPISEAFFRLCGWDIASNEDDKALFFYRVGDKILNNSNIANYNGAIPLALSIANKEMLGKQKEIHFISNKHFYLEERDIYRVTKEYLQQKAGVAMQLPGYWSGKFDKNDLPFLTVQNIATLKTFFTVLDVLLYGFTISLFALPTALICHHIFIPKTMLPDLISKYCLSRFNLELNSVSTSYAVTISTAVISGILGAAIIGLIGHALNEQTIAESQMLAI